MKIILISGNGTGAGKTTLAHTVADQVLSLADIIRSGLVKKYPAYDWYRKDQEYKETTLVTETQKTVREMLVEEGQRRCKKNPAYWVQKLAEFIKADAFYKSQVVAIDDIRKMIELQIMKEKFHGMVSHLHVIYKDAKSEQHLYGKDDEALQAVANYVIIRP